MARVIFSFAWFPVRNVLEGLEHTAHPKSAAASLPWGTRKNGGKSDGGGGNDAGAMDAPRTARGKKFAPLTAACPYNRAPGACLCKLLIICVFIRSHALPRIPAATPEGETHSSLFSVLLGCA